MLQHDFDFAFYYMNRNRKKVKKLQKIKFFFKRDCSIKYTAKLIIDNVNFPVDRSEITCMQR